MLVNLNDLYKDMENFVGKDIVLEGWIRNHRKQKEFGFLDFSDGTNFKTLQVVYDNTANFDEIIKMRVGSSIRVKGKLISSPAKGQAYEFKAHNIELLGDSPENYPIQPKRHTQEFLRSISYLRPRTNLFQAVFRVRSVAAMAIHTYFQDRGYIYLHSPLITGSDCEGAGEMFQVTTLDLDKLPRNTDGTIDYKKDFFGKQTSLTVSGQLQGEAFAMAFKNIYTFGPTFRAENSHTKTHASEFWMIEPEMAFCDLKGCMDIEEDLLKFIVKYVLEKCPSEIEFFNNFVDKGLKQRLNKILTSNFVRITHKEAIDILKKSNKKFEFEPNYDEDIATEHEKYLTEEHFKSPVFITDWPKDIKAFYMRLNNDNKTVAAVDLLVPGSGELMGGSQREERIDLLVKRMKELGVAENGMEWYLDLRKYGGVYHSGFGVGFERLLMYLTGVENIRDVIPFPRTPGNCEF